MKPHRAPLARTPSFATDTELDSHLCFGSSPNLCQSRPQITMNLLPSVDPESSLLRKNDLSQMRCHRRFRANWRLLQVQTHQCRKLDRVEVNRPCKGQRAQQEHFHDVPDKPDIAIDSLHERCIESRLRNHHELVPWTTSGPKNSYQRRPFIVR